MVDKGLCKQNYFDYQDDEVAIQREHDILDGLEGSYVDKEFPADNRSLYMDPFNPPKGSLPGDTVRWLRISDGHIDKCISPKVFVNDAQSSLIDIGALGDKYFVNALRLLAAHPNYIRRIVVSEKNASRGIFTLKFFKAGAWRYIHIDDRIPCRPSGKVNYCRNQNPDEIFAMIIEKAYAKLHGSYEALAFGLMEHVLYDFTAGGHIHALRMENLLDDMACDETWERLEDGMNNEALIGCGRVCPDPYAEHPSLRMGISQGICVKNISNSLIDLSIDIVGCRYNLSNH